MKRPSPTQALRPKQNILDAVELLYISDAASYFNCSQKAIRRRVERKILPYRRLGGRICFLRSELQAFIENLPGTSLAEAQANLTLRSGEEEVTR